MILIGLTGLAGSGKNFVADQITAKYESVKQIAFADPLKQMVHHMFNIPLEDCYTEAGKNRETWVKWMDCNLAMDEARNGTSAPPKGGWLSHMTVRDLLQWVGTDLVRGWWNESHWVCLAEQRIKVSPEEIVVVTDVRFQNEVDLITGMGGVLLKTVGRKAAGIPQHVSECIDRIAVAGMVDNSDGQTPENLMLQVEAYVPGLDKCRVRG